MPDGRIPNSNPAAKNYYHKLIDLLIENNIEPHVTLYHWDLPSALYTEDCPGKLSRFPTVSMKTNYFPIKYLWSFRVDMQRNC